MTKKNNDLNFDNLPKAFDKIAPYLSKAIIAKQDTFRAPTSEIELLFQHSVKHYNLSNINQKNTHFEDAFYSAADALSLDKRYNNLTPEELKDLQAEITAQGEMLDAICNLAINKKHNSNTMRAAVSKAMGCYLYMIHNGNMENVNSDIKNSLEFASDAAATFGSSVKGWESLMGKKA